MTLRGLLLLVSMSLVGLIAKDGLAADGGRADVSVVRSLYDDFAGETVLGDPETQKQLLDQPRAVLARYFTPELTSLVRQDRECAARTKDICKLDFMPIWASQDPSGATVRIAGESTLGEVAVEVRYPNGEKRKLIYRLRMMPIGWRIADIIYADTGESLSRILSAGR